jgi:large subunit ribosomal protein L21
MYAVIRTGGKQYRVCPGQTLRVEKLDAQPGDQVELDQVLMVNADGRLDVGRPTLADVRVKGVVVEQGRSRKVLVFKKKRRKQYRRTRGHRQAYTALRIESIGKAE